MKKPMQNLFVAIIGALCFMQSLHAQSFQGPARGTSESVVIISPPQCASLENEFALPSQSRANGFLVTTQIRPPKPASNQFNFAGKNFTAIPATNSDSIKALADFEGIYATGWPRPDPALAVGPRHVILAVNSVMAVYDKVGGLCFSAELASFFADVLPLGTNVVYNPRLFYDPVNTRWMLLALAGSTAQQATDILLAVSTSAEPEAPWRGWRLDAQKNGNDPIPYYANYLAAGLTANSLTIAIDHVDSTPNFIYTKVRFLETAQLDSTNLSWWDFWELRDSNDDSLSRGLTPTSSRTSDSLTYLMNTKIEFLGPDHDNLELWRLHFAGTDSPRLSSKSYQIKSYYPPADARQPMGPLLAAGDTRVTNVVQHGSKLYGVHTLSLDPPSLTSTRAIFQMISVDLSQDSVISFPVIDGKNSWMLGSAVAVDQDENRAFAQSVVSESLFPSLVGRVRPAPDQPFLIDTCKTSLVPFKSSGFPAPWGRYCDIKIDPDFYTFWLFGPYAASNSLNGWGTQVCAISLKEPDLAVLTLQAPSQLVPGKSYSGRIAFINQGKAFASKFFHELYFSWDALLSADDLAISQPSSKLQRGLNAGEMADSAIAFQLPPSLQHRQGTAYLIYHIDPAAVPESNSNNNTLSLPITLVDSLSCTVAIQTPAANAIVCGDRVNVKAVLGVAGGLSPRLESATINGIATSVKNVNNDTIFALIPLIAGSNTLTAQCVFSDSLGQRAVCTDTISVWARLVGAEMAITSPEDSSFICAKATNVTASFTPPTDHSPLRTICTINSDSVLTTNGSFSRSVTLLPGYNTIVAQCFFIDSSGCTVAVAETSTVFSDPTPPHCVLSFDNLPVITGKVFDHESGLAKIEVFQIINRTIQIAPFTPGDTLVSFTSNEIDPALRSWLNLKVTNRAGCEILCDPVYLRLEPAASPCHFTLDLPESDRYLFINNHGLQRLSLALNAQELHLIAQQQAHDQNNNGYFIPLHGKISFDISSYLRKGENQITITCDGPAGSNADVVFSDFDWNAHTDTPLPKAFALMQNYPNPFNPETSISFEIPAALAAAVSLRILNLQGQMVRMLIDGLIMPPGKHVVSWDGKDDKGRRATTGVYFYQMRVGNFGAVKKMILAR